MERPIAFLPAPKQNRILEANLEFEEAFQRDMAEGFTHRMKAILTEIGVPPRLQKAELGRVPEEIKSMESFLAFPAKPFGLVGPGGAGKSCAMVNRIKTVVLHEIAEAGPRVLADLGVPGLTSNSAPYPSTKTTFRWIGWPAFASRMKGLAARREWLDPMATTAGLIQWATADPEHRILVLDDIGEEGIKAESYVSEQLELLVDDLYNHEARLFWTSNHTPEQLSEPSAYGYRLLSRLTGLAPDAVLPEDMPDMRVGGR